MSPAERDALAEAAMLIDPADTDARIALAERFAATTLTGAARAAAEQAAELLRGTAVDDLGERLGRLTEAALSELPADAAVRTETAAAAVAEFLQRAAGEPDELAALALAWEQGDAASKDELRRRLHTLKGDAGMLGLHDLQDLVHRAEDLVLNASDAAVPLPALLAACTWTGHEINRIAGGEPAGPAPDFTASTAPAERAEHLQPRTDAIARTTLRVEVERVDALADAVGELAIAHAMLTNLVGRSDRRTAGLIARIDRLLRSAQNAANQLRMVPVRPVFQRAERAARELSDRLRRPILVTLDGADTELDKAVVEQLGDPLLHLVRNAMDHGIEDAAGRRAAGKPLLAHLTISAERRDGRVAISVSDDGAGIDRHVVLACARRRGLPLPPDDAPDALVWDLLCQPGFTTSETVSTVSGRGVGLDVVRATAQRLRGHLDIASQLGQGTRFTLELPPTLVSIDGLGLMAGGQRFIIPTTSVRGCLRPRPEDFDTVAGQGRVIPHLGRLLPWRPLTELLGMAPLQAQRPLAVVVDDGLRRAAIAVDSILGRTQAVLKPLSGLPEQPGVVGTAIGTDGRVDLVLDPAGLLSSTDAPVRKAS